MTRETTLHTTNTKQHRFHLLDGLRGLAAIVVVFWHMPRAFQPAFPFHGGFLSVDFFFCLSGFVIAFSYCQRLRSGMSAKDFLVARIIRLYPVYLLGVALGAVSLIFVMHCGFNLGNLLCALLMLPDSHGKGDDFLFNPAAWSLFYEMLANIAFVMFARRNMVRPAWMVATAMVALSFIVFFALHRGSLNAGPSLRTSDIALARVSFSFTAGLLLSSLYDFWHLRGERGSGILAAGVLTALLLFLLISPLAWMGSGWFQAAVIAVAFPAIIYAGAFVRTTGVWTIACVALGDLSYPLYLVHSFYTRLLFSTRVQSALAAYPLLHWWNLGGVVLLLWLSLRIARNVDAPARRFFTQHYQDRSAVRSPAHT